MQKNCAKLEKGVWHYFDIGSNDGYFLGQYINNAIFNRLYKNALKTYNLTNFFSRKLNVHDEHITTYISSNENSVNINSMNEKQISK